MPNPTTPADNLRLDLFKNDLGNSTPQNIAFEKHFAEKNGDWLSIKAALKNDTTFDEDLINKLSFTHELANWTGDNKTLTNHFQENSDTNSLKDIATNFNKGKLKELLTVDDIPKGSTDEGFINGLEKDLFNLEPTAMLSGMIDNKKVLLPGIETTPYILDILNNPGKFGVKDFNIKETSVYAIIKHADFLKDIMDAGLKQKIENDFKTTQRLMTISPDPESFNALIEKKYTSAFQITLLPRNQFIATMNGSGLPQETLWHIYAAAQDKKVLYEHMMVNIREAYQGSGVAAIDGIMGNQNSKPESHAGANGLRRILENNHISWDKLFGDADFCECGECTSMYSPAAYYVELLQYLRNNNLDADAKDSIAIRDKAKDISGTPLEKLFKRRPDLGHLELTCKNTNTILPYVDLVNEVMEQYIAYKQRGVAFNTENYKGFNVADETSGELLSAPQHTEQEKAYQTLSTTVFPFTLPYHQPIDASRIFLNYLGSSRYELLDTFKGTATDINLLNRASDAEYLGLSPEEYLIITQHKINSLTETDTTAISIYFGGNDSKELSEVKEIFLPVTGLEYTELIELLKTDYLNPGRAQGESLTILHHLNDLKISLTDLIKDINDGNIEGILEKNTGLKKAFDGKYELKDLKIIFNKFLAVPKSLVLESPDNCCSIDEVKLKHLDGSYLEDGDFDKFHRFIRLWRKLGFTIDETDKAVIAFRFDKKREQGDITPDLIHQLVAVKKIINLTGIELSKLLCFWEDISTAGENSLYKRLFLTHNLQALDAIFKPVAGVYLNTADTINQHLPGVMAALNLSADDIDSVRTYKAILPADFHLTLSNLSLLYRYRLLSKTLGLRIPALIKLLKVFGDVFSNADTTLQFLQNWGKIEDVGFNAEQLSYLINGTDRDVKPLAPSEKEVIIFTKNIYDGINNIEKEHADLRADDAGTEEEKATSELVRGKAALLFDTAIVEQIMNILEAPGIFRTTLPSNLDIDWPSPNILEKKVAYNKSSGILTITLTDDGVLSQLENDTFDNLKNKSIAAVNYGIGWSEKLTNTAAGQVQQIEVPKGIDIDWPSPNILQTKISYDASAGMLTISGLLDTAETAVFKNLKSKPVPAGPLGQQWTNGLLTIVFNQALEEGKIFNKFKNILSGIFSAPQQEIIEKFCKTGPSAPKRLAFIKTFLPYLRTALKKRLITDELSKATALDKPIVETISVNILKNDTENLYDKLAKINEAHFQNVKAAYLMPQVGADYTFAVKDNTIQLLLNNKQIDFTTAVVADVDYWSLKPEPLDAVKVYQLSVKPKDGALSLKDVHWKTSVTQPVAIPPAQLIPKEAFDIGEDVLKQVKKLAILISTLNLGADELNYFQLNADFSRVDFKALQLHPLLRITDYCNLRNSLPKAAINLLQFWQLINNQDIVLSEHIASLTQWKKENIEKLISPGHFNLGKDNFKNEQNLLKLQKALAVADKIGVDIDKLFDWALPAKDFAQCKEIADSIQKAIRSRYNQTDWEQVVKPLNDLLRNNQKNAFIAYLLQQEGLKKEKVKDADGLFEYFLIDVQMDTCMETSRIKQAISSVQLFIQRCFIGLESKIEDGNEKGIGATVLTVHDGNGCSATVYGKPTAKYCCTPKTGLRVI